LTKLNSLRFGAARTESRAPSGQKPRKIGSNLYKICMQDIFLRKPCMKALCVHDETISWQHWDNWVGLLESGRRSNSYQQSNSKSINFAPLPVWWHVGLPVLNPSSKPVTSSGGGWSERGQPGHVLARVKPKGHLQLLSSRLQTVSGRTIVSKHHVPLSSVSHSQNGRSDTRAGQRSCRRSD
jgi:hypothetical protein